MRPPRNLHGPSGLNGPHGPSGLNGPHGPSGPNGPHGPSGLNGPHGPSGLNGPHGPSGLNGPHGLSGLNGRLIVVAGLVWLSPDRLLVQRRPVDKPHGGGRLELPGGKVEPGEAPRDALARELVEEWGPHARLLTPLTVAEVLHHVYPPPGPEVLLVVYHVDASAWAARDASGEAWTALLRAEAGASVHAVDRAALPLDEFLEADRDFLIAVQAGFHGLPTRIGGGGGADAGAAG